MDFFKGIINFIIGLLVPLYGILSFVWKNVLWFVALGLMIFIFLQHDHNQVIIAAQALQLQDAKNAAASAAASNKALADALNNEKIDQANIDNFMNKYKNTVQNQTTIEETIQNVPVKNTDRPFVTDPGLVTRVGIMRHAQESYTNSSQ